MENQQIFINRGVLPQKKQNVLTTLINEDTTKSRGFQ
jgi:hypothetical protein